MSGIESGGAPDQPIEPAAPAVVELPVVRNPLRSVASPDRRQQLEDEFREVQKICVFYGAILLPILAGAGWRFHSSNTGIEASFWTAGALYVAIVGFAIAWRREWLDLVRWPVGDGWGILTMVTPITSIGAALALVAGAEHIGLPVQELTEGYGENGYPLWILFLTVTVLPPVFEEIAFRGVLLSKLQRLMGPGQAIWVSAFLFGIVHFSVLSMAVFLVPLAVIAGYLTRRTRSLLPAIAVHATHNTGMIVLELVNL